MQSLETKSSIPRPKSFEAETRPSRPRLQKTGLETETKSRDSFTATYIPCLHYGKVSYSFINFMCSAPVPIEHW